MRWIFFSLVVMNLVIFAWGMVAGSSERPVHNVKPARNPYQNVPQLRFLDEMDSSDFSSSQYEQSKNDLRSKDSIVVEERELCDLVGPFESKDIANDFVRRLQAIEVVGLMKDIDLPAGPGYWVYLAPEASRREALRLLGELQSKKIDSYVIPKGELENGISLGMYSKRDLAIARKSSIERLGLDPQIEEIERSYREIWVMLSKGEGEKMSDLSWERAMEGINMLERRQNYCLDVASQENFQ